MIMTNAKQTQVDIVVVEPTRPEHHRVRVTCCNSGGRARGLSSAIANVFSRRGFRKDLEALLEARDCVTSPARRIVPGGESRCSGTGPCCCGSGAPANPQRAAADSA